MDGLGGGPRTGFSTGGVHPFVAYAWSRLEDLGQTTVLDKVSFQTITTLTDAQIPGTWESLEWVLNKQPKIPLDQITLLSFVAVSAFGQDPEFGAAGEETERNGGISTIGRQRAHLTKIANPPESVPLAQLSSEIIAWENSGNVTFLDHVNGIASTPMDIGSLGKESGKGNTQCLHHDRKGIWVTLCSPRSTLSGFSDTRQSSTSPCC